MGAAMRGFIFLAAVLAAVPAAAVRAEEPLAAVDCLCIEKEMAG
jgi:hypothetical protein